MDFRIVQAAPWWTRDRLMLAVGTVLVGMLLVLVWNLTLRRRVATKSAALSHALRGQHNAELEFEAERRERRRLAADLHDLIAQGIAAAASQLDAARAYETREPGKAAAHRAVAREQLTQCSADVRRTLWGLRADVLDGRTFPQALKALATRLTQGTDVVCRVECSPDLTETLPDFIAGNLLILVQEAVSNAIRHAGTSEILVTCSLDSAGVVMHIEDSGKGFQPEASPGVQDGHFGLRSMRERIDLLHGSITIASQPGSGTRLTVHLPRSSFGFADAFTAL
jgi:signal transduction histidine kinase